MIGRTTRRTRRSRHAGAPRFPGAAHPYPRGLAGRLVSDELDGAAEILGQPERLAQAVAAAKRGDAAAWDELFERFHADVHAYALARLGDWSGAEDVTQDTFVAAVGSIRGLRDDREPVVRAWFLHICRHKTLDHIRRLGRQQRPVAMPAAADEDPSEVAENHIRADEMREAMNELTEEQRDIMVRRFVLDQSLDDVALATGRSVGAVKSLQHRALATLQRIIAARSAA